VIFYILIEAKGFVIGTDDNLLMRFTNSFVLKGNFMEKHTLGYPQLSAVFLDTANKYKQDLMNEPIKWEKINNFIESIFRSVYSSGNDYGENLTQKQLRVANQLSDLLFTHVKGLILSVEIFRVTEDDYLELCHGAIECANESRRTLVRFMEAFLARSGCREVNNERLQREIDNFLRKNEDKMLPRVNDIDNWLEALRLGMESVDIILAEFNPEPEKEEQEPSLELEDSVLICMQRTLGNLRGLDIPECQEACRSIERFLRGRNYQVIWPDPAMEHETLEFFVCHTSAVTENQLIPCIKYGEWVSLQGELIKPEADCENMKN